MCEVGLVQYTFALRYETWENVSRWKWDLMRPGVDRFGGICRMRMHCGLCDSELVFAVASTDSPAAKKAICSVCVLCLRRV
jgi:hypothetical protein